MRAMQVNDGEWVHFSRRGEKLECCDCGLVHDLEFEVRRGRVYLRFRRDRRETAAVRLRLQGR